VTYAPAHVEPVQEAVDRLLARSAAFQKLPATQREQLRRDMAQVGAYLADPALLGQVVPGSVQARALEDKPPPPVEQLKGRLAEKPGQVDFQANAMKQGVEQFGALVQKVDFPKFVAGLVQGVFQAIVNASIQQMQAFGDLLSAAAKSTQQFSDDYISDAQARDHIATRYPSLVQVDTSGDTAVLKPREGADTSALAQQFGTGDDLTDEEQEQNLVNQAKLQMAQSKQQNLAMMVLMGINRIVVTNGQINAKVLFDISASDSAKRVATAQMHDAQKESSHASVTGPFGDILGGGEAGWSSDHTTTVASAVDDTSESKAQMKATLSGDVHIQFKSDVFPLEKMVDVMSLQSINQKAQPMPAGPRGTPPPSPAPAQTGAAK
jgi:hypothetical protein